MNAQQRRKAYRSIDRMIGRIFDHTKIDGQVIVVKVIGRTAPVRELASSALQEYAFDGSRASVHRVRCLRIMSGSGATFSPGISSLRAV